eukprot:1305310-Rhodomonas_salina.2
MPGTDILDRAICSDTRDAQGRSLTLRSRQPFGQVHFRRARPRAVGGSVREGQQTSASSH